MKMSKVFELPVEHDGSVIRYEDEISIMDLYGGSSDSMAAIAHAINNHDKLIDLLKQAVGRVVISAADQDELQWFIEVMDVLEGEL